MRLEARGIRLSGSQRDERVQDASADEVLVQHQLVQICSAPVLHRSGGGTQIWTQPKTAGILVAEMEDLC